MPISKPRPSGNRHKWIAYITGFLLGCIILCFIPHPESKAPHPWHKQTAPEGYYPLEIRDDLNRTILLEQQPRHLISLAPSITEILFAMDMGDHLVGVTQFCNEPEAARSIEQIGGLNTPNYEKILQLHPDLVIGTEMSGKETYQKLQTLNIDSIALSHRTVDDIFQDIALIGKIIGTPGKALKLVNQINRKIETIKEDAAQNASQSVLILYDFKNLVSAGSGTWINDLLGFCNADNIAANLPSAWPKLSPESIIAENPDTIIILSKKSKMAECRKNADAFFSREVWHSVSAVKNKNLIILDISPFNIPGPRLTDALKSLHESLHPKASAQDL